MNSLSYEGQIYGCLNNIKELKTKQINQKTKLIYSTKITGKIKPQQHIHTNFILILTETVKLNKIFIKWLLGIFLFDIYLFYFVNMKVCLHVCIYTSYMPCFVNSHKRPAQMGKGTWEMGGGNGRIGRKGNCVGYVK